MGRFFEADSLSRRSNSVWMECKPGREHGSLCHFIPAGGTSPPPQVRK
jgi:hypothetical protein